ncbi:MAG TPA: 4-alpha-glucanotransferase [Mycobacteriales bacterium]|nr:4-alpha-glucanotransferase [Mycobacteriales bacterium]
MPTADEPPGAALTELAVAHGVMSEYLDWSDEPVQVSADTIAAVLAALGVDASTEQAVAVAVADARAAPWRRPVAPTVVVSPRCRTALVRAENAPEVVVELEGGRAVEVTAMEPTGRTHDLDGRVVREYEATLPADLPLGYHRLVVQADGTSSDALLVVAPSRCPGTEALGRVWGWMVQLYAVRSAASWGVGDYGDLRALAEWTGSLGGDLLLCNPLHAASPTLPQVDSPYSPSSRRFRLTGGIRVTDIPEAALLDDAGQARLDRLAHAGAALNSVPLLDRDAAARVHRQALELVFAAGRPDEREAALASYRAERGAGLVDFATWCALAEVHGADWTEWPDELRDPHSPAVTAARDELRDSVAFHEWLQWVCDEQLRDAQATARRSGQRIGIVHDLAVGVTPTGADAWLLRDVLALDVFVGAPPDSFNQRGQDWALPPMRPDRLLETGYAAYRDMLRSVLRHAGGIRIDHAMGLFRLYWIPGGGPATRGTYVRYPAEDLLAILALEAHLAGAVVIAEDLGTVEDGVPETLAEWGIHGSAVLWFERADDGEFVAPSSYRDDVFASVTTHDLPTALGFWRGEATTVRAELDLLGAGRTEAEQVAMDDEERAALLALLEREGLAHEESSDEERALAMQALVARSRSRLLGLSLGDAVGDVRQPNLPGTTDAYPNWRLTLADSSGPVAVEELDEHPGVRRVVEIARTERPRR